MAWLAVADKDQPEDRVVLTAEQLRRRRNRSVALALALGALVLIMIALTLVRGPASIVRPL